MTLELKTDVTTVPSLPHEPVVTNTEVTDGAGGNYEPKTDEVEGIVEEFQTILKNQSIGDEPFQKSYELLHFQPLLIKWLRTTLQNQADKAKREREKLVREIIAAADLTPYAEEHNGELVDCSFYQIYAGKIKATATAHNINLDT